MTTETISQALQSAVRAHNAGQLREAEQLYRRILQADPRNAQAMYLLGLMAYQVGKHDAAVQLLSNAIRLDGGQPHFHSTLGEAFRSQGNTRDALVSYRQALRLRPNFPEAHNNLGTLLESQGDVAAAEISYREAIRLAPQYADPHQNLGNLYQRRGDREQAVAAYTEAVRLKPDDPQPRLALASLLESCGKSGDAREHFCAVSHAHGDLPQTHSAYGAARQAVGDYEAAIASYARAIELDPNYADGHFNLGTALQAIERDAEAVEAYQQALRINPQMALAWSNLANVCLGLVRPDEAAYAARQAQQLQPRSNTVLGNLAAALQMQGDMDGAIAAYRQAVELQPDDSGNHSNLIYTLNFHPGYDDAQRFAEHRAWAERHAEPITAAAAPHAGDRTPDRRLKVGYVSAHFRHHAVAFFAEPLLAAHDRQQVELYCYAHLRRPDETSERFRARADQWRDITRVSAAEVAEIIRRDQIDLLVDLDGHIGGNRLLVFAHKPAPVHVTYLGYQNTTGMSAMDYRLTDAHADPVDQTDRWYTERLVRLPGAFFCFAPPEAAPEVSPSPAQVSGRVTFASLNHMHKLTEAAFATWARILQRVPDARLLVLGYAGGVFERNVRAILAERGIVDTSRVEVVEKRPRYDYLAMHSGIDIALDAFPFNGHTTVCDALWMGVPSIMLEGDCYASRFGGSTLLGVGLGELVARSTDKYVDLAVELAQNVDRLAELRRTLRGRMSASPLVDATGFTRGVEQAYRDLWHQWCRQS